MAVGTGAIKLSDVTAELPLTQNSLQDCVDDAINANYDPVYEDAPPTDRLSGFRGYSAGDTEAPSTPTGMSAVQPLGLERANLSWNASTDNVAVTNYVIDRQVNGGSWATGWRTIIGTPPGTTATDLTVTFGNSYAYRVSAKDAAGNESSDSSSDSVSIVDPCFVEGTIITLWDGKLVPIETLSVGSKLKSPKIENFQDTQNVELLHEWESENIKEIENEGEISKFEKQTVHQIINLNDGLLETTPNHNHLIFRDGVWKFREAHTVKIGDVVRDINGNHIQINSIVVTNEPRTIYYMTISPSHTFYANNILTHNIK